MVGIPSLGTKSVKIATLPTYVEQWAKNTRPSPFSPIPTPIKLDEKIYINQPVGLMPDGQERKVCKFKRSIYGLKQLSRQWYLRFHQVVLCNGFTMIEEDHYVSVKRSNVSFIIFSLNINDILLAKYNKDMIVATKRWLSSNFELHSGT
jgi:hypothetical protein